MTKKSAKVEVNNFIQGLITEASPLNFPANATVEEANFVLNRDGTRDRRLGLDFESGYNLIPVSATPSDIANNPPIPFKWLNANGDANSNFLVIQIKDSLMIFNLDNIVISSESPVATISLAAHGFSSTVKYSFTAVDGKLVVVSGINTILVITYNGTTFSVTESNIKVRDMWGVEVKEDLNYETDIQYRGGLPGSHFYNLYNQSWAIPRQHALGGTPAFGDAVAIYNAGTGKYPSNSETVWPGLQFTPVAAGADPYERMYPALYEQSFGSSVKAAKGFFVIDLLRRGVSRSEQVAINFANHPELALHSLTTVADVTEGGAKIVCEFAGRVWYAGFGGKVIDGDARSPSLSSYVAFSQLVRNTNDIVKCHQEGDPTSRDNNDVVDTDGGLIRLSGVREILGMIDIGSSLIIFANNGVWAITGGNQYGFSATNYKVDHISTFGVIAPHSIVSDGSRALYWAADGIYVVEKNQYGDLTVNSLTQKNIQGYYEDIPALAKASAIGVFEATGKKIRWIYHDGEMFTNTSVTKELIIDLTIGAFYPFTIGRLDSNSVECVSMFSSTPFASSLVDDTVLVGTDVVNVVSTPVVVESQGRSAGILDTRYLALVVIGNVPYIAFAYYNNSRFLDWESVDNIGVDAKAYLITGAVTANDSSAAKQVPYLTMHFYRTENGVDINLIPQFRSSCLVRSQWDWANSANSNKWSSFFQAYRQRKEYLPVDSSDPYDTGFEIITSKNKLRGRGKAFALYLETEPLYDCRIIGWSIALNGNVF